MGNHAGRGQTTRELLTDASRRIANSLARAPEGSAETPFLDAIVLLCDATRTPRERLLGMMNEPVALEASERFEAFVQKRCSGMPVSYVRGKKEFFGREFEVNEHVLVPRPETEHIVEYAIGLLDRPDAQGTMHIHDCCTGSGAIAITIAAERPGRMVTASDISAEALAVSGRNAERILGSSDRVLFFESDLLSELDVRVARGELPRPTTITSNPPYLTAEEYQRLHEAQWPEPELALNAGPSGFEIITRLVTDAARLLAPGGNLIIEIGAQQGSDTRSLFQKAGYDDIEIVKDLAGRDRICAGRIDG
jgi:release factor glutamine methyltransferase